MRIVTVMTAAMLGLAGCGSVSTVGTHPAVPSVSSVFAAVSLPQGSVRLSSGGHLDPRPLGHGGDSTVAYQDWSSPRSMNATMAWISAHMAATWSTGGLNRYDLGRTQEWDGPANRTEFGPNLTVTVTAKGKGAHVEVAAWTIALGDKTSTELLTGVTGASAHVTNDNGSFIKPFSVTLTLAQAQRFAADIDALPVDHPVTWSGLGGTPDVTLTFQTAGGRRSFLAIRNAYLVTSLGGGPDLIMSAALEHELDVDIPKGQSSRPPTDQHPVLPDHISSATFTTGQARGLRVVSPLLTGATLRRLIADLRPLSVDPVAGRCTKKGQPEGELVVHGVNGDRDFAYSGNCDELSPLSALDGQLVIPFATSPAFEADIAALLR